jgi:hypothetical protein
VNPLDLIWLFFILSSLQPVIAQKILAVQRGQALRALEKRSFAGLALGLVGGAALAPVIARLTHDDLAGRSS